VAQEIIPRQLGELFEIREILQQCTNLPDLLGTCVSLARKYVRSQTAAVFLFSKEGRLKREALDGVDKNGAFINGDWFPCESYELGRSFTGRVPVPVPPSKFGQPRWTSSLSKEGLEPRSYDTYFEALGPLESAAAVPLNGRHRTFGVLEVINKVDQNSKVIHSGLFSQSEIGWLGLIAVAAAGAITTLRSQQELALLRYVSQVIASPFDEESDPKTTYEKIAIALTSGFFTSYKACIIRTGSDLGSLEVVARAGDGVSFEERLEGARTETAIVSKVFLSGERDLIQDIEPRLDEFVNRDWIASQGFKSIGCFPLSIKNHTVGTMSLFTGYRHSFDDTELEFVESIVSLLASFTEGIYRDAIDQQSISSEHTRFVTEARLAERVTYLDDMRHVDKEILQDLKSVLEELSGDVGTRARKILENQIAKIESRLGSTQQELSNEGLARLSVNDVVQQLVSNDFRQEFKQKKVTLDLNLDKQLPDIEAREREIKLLLWNLLTNAIKAIEAANRKEGHIGVTTAQSTQDRKEILEITVEDNGIGIKKEMQEDIFKRGFSTFRGGTGFGLFSVQRTADKYGGRIVVDSTLGKGSRFSVRLPLKQLRVS
jgi:signal transduction histidine kinase